MSMFFPILDFYCSHSAVGSGSMVSSKMKSFCLSSGQKQFSFVYCSLGFFKVNAL